MTFFYDLNKRLADLASKQDAQHLAEHATPAAQQPKKGSLAQALNERDMGKHNNKTTGFDALAKKAGKEYGSKAAGERVAGAQFQKMKKSGKLEEQGMDEAVRGLYYGDQGYQPPTTQAQRDATAKDVKQTRAKNRADTRVTGYGNRVEPQRGPESASGLARRTQPSYGGQETPVDSEKTHPYYSNPKHLDNYGNLQIKPGQGKGVAKEGQLNELSPELLKRARDKAGEKWSAADDRKDKKASDKYNRQDDKFNSALRKKQKDMDESAVRIMAKPEGSQVTRGTAAYVPKNSIAGKTPQGQAHRDATAAMAKAARAAGGKLAMNKTTDVTGKRVPGGYDAMAKGVTPYRSSTEEGNAFTGKLKATPKGGNFKLGDKTFKDTSSIEEGHCPACDCSPCECDTMEESAFQAAIGKKKYGDAGMKALQKAGREHASDKTMSTIRNRYDKYDESQGMTDEGNAFSKAVVDAKRDGIQKGEKIRVGGKELPLKELDMRLLKGMQGSMKGSNTDTESERNRHKKYGYRSDRDDTGNDDDYDEYGNLKNKKKAAVSDGPKKKGRPTKEKRPERVTAKSYKYKDGRPTKTKEDLDTDGVMMTRPSNMSSEGYNPSEYDQEGEMTKDSLHTVIRHAEKLEQCLQDAENLPTWVIEKIGQIKGMMTSVSDYIISSHERGAEQGMREPELDEEKVEAGKREFFDRLAPAARKAAKVIKVMSKGKEAVGEESTDKEDTKAERAGKKVAKDIEYDEGHKGKDDNKAEKAGKKVTKDIEYDDKKDKKEKKDGKEEKVDETTVAGSVATASPSGKSSKGGMSFGKGVYESLDRQFKQALTESISIESKMQECGDGEMAPAITIQADGEEAAKLMMLLKLAGLESQIPKACPSCGASPCGCDQMVDENAPDWPTNTDTLTADPNLRTYSGGLNGPKSTGQTTVPVVASQLRRQASMEESIALERSLFKTWQNYKG